jgi:Undecaprenyl-phosphate galactose phosphotransferase WbaP
MSSSENTFRSTSSLSDAKGSLGHLSVAYSLGREPSKLIFDIDRVENCPDVHIGTSSFASRISLILKRCFDFTFALLALILLFPLLIVLCVIIKSDGGSIFFLHTRVGYRGRLFNCIKFRTMKENNREILNHYLATDPAAAAEWRESQKLRNDPRVTRIGRFLRATSLDELPQLFNVLRNQMSLVGPRPIVIDEVKRYDRNIAYYIAVFPGITGLWQVSGRSNTSYERRVELDVYYVQTWSLLRDISILFMTIPAVILRKGAH